MKKKVLISFIIIFIIFGIIVSNNVFAMDSFMNDMLTQMQTSRAGVTNSNLRTVKVIRTVYAMVQIFAVGMCIVLMTWHSMQFFSSNPETRKTAKESLPWRLAAIAIILGIGGIISIIAKYFGA